MCDNSGAITLRGRSELPEVVQVALPMQPTTDHVPVVAHADAMSDAAPESQPKSTRPIVIRIPECGGLPNSNNGEIIRGWLLLEVAVAEMPSHNLRWLDNDEDPLSSAKLLRAEVRIGRKDSAPATDASLVVTTARSLRPSRRSLDSDAPPSSRVARVGSTVPPVERRSNGQPMLRANEIPAQSVVRARASANWVYSAILVIAVLVVLALVLL